MEKKTALLGIDFGASNIKVVYFNGKTFKAKKLNKQDSSGDETSNCLWYKILKSGELEKVIGKKARNQLAINSANVISDIKRKLYLPEWKIFIPALDREISREEAIEDIFTVIKDKLEFSKDTELVAVLTVPVTFTAMQRRCLRQSAERAGIKVAAVISESFAASFALEDQDEERLICVFDFGGSTIDASVVQMGQEEGVPFMRELSASGLRLGGLDLDRSIFDKILLPRHAASIDTLHDGRAEAGRKSIFYALEDYKMELFAYDGDETSVILPEIVLRKDEIIELIEEERYRERIHAMLDQLFERLEEGLDGFTRRDITKVYPFGGGMRIPYFREVLEEYFSPDIFSADEYDEEDTEEFVDGLESRYTAVAAGAARYLRHLMENGEEIQIVNYVPFEIGFMRDDVFELCVSRNSPQDFESAFKPLTMDWLEEKDWKIPLYQRLETDGEIETVYMGDCELDKAKYKLDEPLLLKMAMKRNGNLRVRIFQKENDKLPCKEEREFVIGG